ncbi:MAG: hypothetical protein ACTSRU_02790 [Candidatus Hodarchaeales archaeon]
MSGETSRDSTEAPKIGVFVCHCGKNIAGTVDVKKVVEEVKDQPNVVVATDYMFMCSKQGIELIKDSIKNKGINRTVVASCSKTQHGKTFAKAIEEAGLNKHLHFQVNIREHCSWVHASYYSGQTWTSRAGSPVGAIQCEETPSLQVFFPVKDSGKK